jgi:hypothetical protein
MQTTNFKIIIIIIYVLFQVILYRLKNHRIWNVSLTIWRLNLHTCQNILIKPIVSWSLSPFCYNSCNKEIFHWIFCRHYILKQNYCIGYLKIWEHIGLSYTVRTIISAPPLQNAVSHQRRTDATTAVLFPESGGVTHGILQRWHAYDCTHCITVLCN